VQRAAVVGRPVADGNEEILAFIETEDHAPIDMDALHAHVADNLAPYKRPAYIRVVASFPMTLSGKVLKRELVASFGN